MWECYHNNNNSNKSSKNVEYIIKWNKNIFVLQILINKKLIADKQIKVFI